MANIISLTLENFRSYKNRTEFSFEAIDSDKKRGNYHNVALKNGNIVRLLNSAVVYGANAAGKSNVIIALWALSSFVKFSKRYDPEKHITYEPYLFCPQKRNAPIYFSIQFVVEGVAYRYEILYDKKKFLSESLRVVDDNSCVFERNGEGMTHFNSDYLPGMEDEVYLKNHLALSELSLKANPMIQAIYKEISSINVIIPLADEYRMDDNTSEVAKWMHDEPDGQFTKLIKGLMLNADTGIVDVVINERDEKEFRFLDSVTDTIRDRFIQENRFDINMLHPSEDGETVPLQLRKESAGTRTLFTAGAKALKALQEGSLLAYDEMNIALHPLLFRRLVELFNTEETNPQHAQLLVTTHDTILLEDNLLRADQVWFAEKKDGVSELYSAIDFDEVSIDQPFEAWYRAGRLGGQPHLGLFSMGETRNDNEA